MLRKLALLLLALMGVSAVILAKENTATSTRNIEIGTGITAVKTTMAIDVEVTIAAKASPTARLTASEDILSDIVVKNNNGILEVGLKKNTRTYNHTKRTMTLQVTLDSTLNTLSAATSGTITLKTPITTDGTCKISANTSGTVCIPTVNATRADIDAATSGTVDIGKIKTTSAELHAATSADIKVNTLKTQTLTVEGATAANIKVGDITAKVTTVNATTSADITAAGYTADISLRAVTCASINAKNLKAETGSATAATAGHVNSNILRPTKTKSQTGGKVIN